jgi:hypothetical protein
MRCIYYMFTLTAKCSDGQAMCVPASGQCINTSSMCDGIGDCYQNVDESECGNYLLIRVQICLL